MCQVTLMFPSFQSDAHFSFSSFSIYLVINPQHIHDINANIDNVDVVAEGQVKLIVVRGQAEVPVQGHVLVAHQVLLWRPSRPTNALKF